MFLVKNALKIFISLFIFSTSTTSETLHSRMVLELDSLKGEDLSPKKLEVLKALIKPVALPPLNIEPFKSNPFETLRFLTGIQNYSIYSKDTVSSKINSRRSIALGKYMGSSMAGEGIWRLEDRCMIDAEKEIFVRGLFAVGKGFGYNGKDFNEYESNILNTILHSDKIGKGDDFEDRKNRHKIYTLLFTYVGFKGIESRKIQKDHAIARYNKYFKNEEFLKQMIGDVWTYTKDHLDLLDPFADSLQKILKDKIGIACHQKNWEEWQPKAPTIEEKWHKNLLNYYISEIGLPKQISLLSGLPTFDVNDGNDSASNEIFEEWNKVLQPFLKSISASSDEKETIKDLMFELAFLSVTKAGKVMSLIGTTPNSFQKYIDQVKQDSSSPAKLIERLKEDKKSHITDFDKIREKTDKHTLKEDYTYEIKFQELMRLGNITKEKNSNLLKDKDKNKHCFAYQSAFTGKEFSLHFRAKNVEQNAWNAHEKGFIDLSLRIMFFDEEKINTIMKIKNPQFWYFNTIDTLIVYDPSKNILIQIAGKTELNGKSREFCLEKILASKG